MLFGALSKSGFGKVGRAFLLGTSALVMSSTAASADSFTITVDTVASKVLGPAADETGIVQEGVTLSPGIYSLPTVDIIGSGATLTNLGTISGGALWAGVVRATGRIDGVTITNSGTISSIDSIALDISHRADVTGGVSNSGTIFGDFVGVLLTTSSSISGGIDNAGTIKGDVGIFLDTRADISGPGLINQAGGLISGRSIGIFGTNAAKMSGGVDNSGTIKGHTAAIFFRATASISGGVVNQAGGMISGVSSGIGLHHNASISGGLSNGGTLKGGNSGLVVASFSDISGPGLVNQAGGTISGGGKGVLIGDHGDISGGIDNHGTIKSDADSTSVALGVDGTLTGRVTNQSGATILGNFAGIRVDNSADISTGIDNDGTIQGGFGIIALANGNISGGIDNSGTIEGTASAAILDGNNSLAVTNSGTLMGAAGLAVGLRGGNDSLTLNTGSVLVGNADGGDGTDALILKGTSSEDDDFLNFETLELDSTELLSMTAWALDGNVTLGGPGTVTVTNGRLALGGILTARGGVLLGAGGALTVKTGARIAINPTTGVLASDGTTVAGDVTNSGTISGANRGVSIGNGGDISGGIDNHGTIKSDAGSTSVALGVDGTLTGRVTNQSGATILGNFAGIRVDNSADISTGIDNDGTIQGGFGIIALANGNISGGIDNSGTIEGTASAAILDGNNSLAVTNSGTLMGAAGLAVGLRGGNDSLTLNTGSVLVGNADGGGDTDALILKGTSSEDDDFLNFENLEMKGVDWGLSGLVTLLNGAPGPGTASVTSGRLRVNGTLTAPGGVSVAAAGTLGGTGEVVGQVTNQGTIAPGNSVGTLLVTGDVDFAAGSSLAIEVDGSGIDLLDVDGNVTVDPAAVLDMTFQPGAVDVQGAVVTQATGSIDAAFTTVNTNDKLVAVSLVGGNALELDVVGVASVNAAVAASAEEGFSFQNAVAGAQLSPRDPGSATPLWVSGISEAAPGAGGTQQAISGVLFGGDVASFSGGALRLGVAGGYVSSDAQALVGTNSSAAEGLQAGTYGTYDLALPGGATQLTFGLHGGYQTQEAERAVVVGGTRTVGRGETQGSLMGGYLGASREFSLGEHMTLRPGARLGYLHQELEGYRDSAGLQVGALSVDSLRFGPQVELSGEYQSAGGVTFKPRGQVGWSQQVALGAREVRLTLPSGAGGKVALDDGNAGSLNVAFGLDMVFDAGTSAYLSFDGTYGSAQTRTSAFAGLSFDLW